MSMNPNDFSDSAVGHGVDQVATQFVLERWLSFLMASADNPELVSQLEKAFPRPAHHHTVWTDGRYSWRIILFDHHGRWMISGMVFQMAGGYSIFEYLMADMKGRFASQDRDEMDVHMNLVYGHLHHFAASMILAVPGILKAIDLPDGAPPVAP